MRVLTSLVGSAELLVSEIVVNAILITQAYGRTGQPSLSIKETHALRPRRQPGRPAYPVR